MGLNFFKEAPEVHVASQGYESSSDNAVENRAGQAESGDIYARVAQWVILVGILLLPIFFLPWSTNLLEVNKQFLLVLVAGTGLILWLLSVVISGVVKIRLNLLDKGVLGLLAASIVTTLFSLDRYQSLFGSSASISESSITVIALAVLYFLVVNLFSDGGRRVKKYLGISIVAVMLIGLLQMFTVYILPFDFANSRAFNTIGSLNALGLIAAISLPFFLRVKLRVYRGFDLAIAGRLLSLAVLAILSWWILWLVAIAGLVSVVVFDSLALKGSFRVSRFLFPMTVIVVAVFLMIVNFNITAVKKNFPVEIAPSFKLSMDIAKSTLEDSLIFGYGAENFSLAFDKFGAGRLAGTNVSNIKFLDSTSQFFNGVVNGGVIYLAAIAFLFWTIFSTILKTFRSNSGPEATGIMSVVVAILVALFVYPFNISAMFIMFMGLALLLLSDRTSTLREYNIEDKPVLSLTFSLGFVAGLIAVLAGAYFLVTIYLSDVKYAQALAEKDRGKAATALVEAINWNGDDRYYRSASQISLQLLAQELNKKADRADTQRATRVQGYISSAIDLAQRATKEGPLEAANWFNLAEVYQNLLGLVDGVDKFAEENYLKSAELRVGDPTTYVRIGSLYLSKADLSRRLAASTSPENAGRFTKDASDALAKSEAAFKKATELSSNFGLAIYNLGVVYERQGKLQEAIRQLEKIAPFNSDQPNLMFELGLLYYRAGNKDASLAALQRAVLLSPDFANARWYLGLIYEERKDFNMAIEQMENILENNSGNEVVIKKIDDLRKGISSFPPAKVIDQQPL